MDGQQITQFIQEYGYWILYPLTILEGPLATLAGGGLAALGLLKVELVFIISLFGDLTMDLVLYAVGFFGNQRLRDFIRRHPKIETRRKKLQTFFENHGGKVIFLVKITIGLSYITFITAGMIRMPLKKFLIFSFLGGIIWSGVLVSIGYFYGSIYQKINDHIEQAGILIICLVIITLIGINLLEKFKVKQFIKKH